MNKTALLILSLLLTVSGYADEVSFTRLVEAAGARDARLKAGGYAVEVRQAVARAAQGFFYPQLSLASAYNKTKRYRPVFTTQPERYFQHRAIVNQVIVNERRRYDYLAAKEEITAERHNLHTTEQAVYQEVIQARLNLHAAQEQFLLLESRLKATSERLKLVRRRHSGGIGTYLDVGLIQAEQETISAELESVKAQIANARQQLTSLTAVMADELPQLKEDFTFPLLPALPLLREMITQNNPELVSMDYQVQIQRLRRRAVAADRAPSLSVSGERGYSDETSNHFSVAVQLSIPVYSGGIIGANYLQAHAQMQLLLQSLADAKRQVRYNTEQLYNNAQSIIRQEQLLQSAISVQQTLLEKTRRAWLEGVRLTQDVIDAEQNLFSSRLQQRNLYYSYMAILTQLRQLEGKIDTAFLQQLDSYFE